MVQVKQRVAGARNRVHHLCANATVSAAVGSGLYTAPELDIRVTLEAGVDDGLVREDREGVRHGSLDAVI